MKKCRFSLAKQHPRRQHRQQREAVGNQPLDVLRQVIRLHMRCLQPARRMRTEAQMPCGKQQRADRKEEQAGMQADAENGGEAEQRKEPRRAALVKQPVRKPRGKQKPEKRRGEEIAVAIEENRPARRAEHGRAGQRFPDRQPALRHAAPDEKNQQRGADAEHGRNQAKRGELAETPLIEAANQQQLQPKRAGFGIFEIGRQPRLRRILPERRRAGIGVFMRRKFIDRQRNHAQQPACANHRQQHHRQQRRIYWRDRLGKAERIPNRQAQRGAG